MARLLKSSASDDLARLLKSTASHDLTMEVCGSCFLEASLRRVFAESIYPLDSRILLVPLSEDQHNTWLHFLNLAGRPQWHHCFTDTSHKKCFKSEKALLKLNDPFVPVVSDFAVDAFNELCRMYFKEGVEDNIYEAEVTSVKYSPNCFGYTFFITLEAMEEAVIGVYKTTVLCHYDDGRRTLLKFSRSLQPPVGEKFKGMADLVLVESGYLAVKEQEKAMKAELKIRCNAMKGKKRSKESAELISLKEDYKTVKGACRVFDKYAHRINWKIKWSYPDEWLIPNKMTGLQPRSVEHSCGGYDYHNPLTVFSIYI